MKVLLGCILFSLSIFGQNAVLPPSIHNLFLDQNGRPLNGGFIYTCVSSTACSIPTPGSAPSNPQPTYSDAGATSQNANPVVLDYTGWSQIRLKCGLSYKIVAQDRFNVQQWTLDNVAGSCPPSGGIIDATGVTGDFLVPGTLTTGQGPLIDVTAPAYGAVHNGIADDTAHIQLAFNFAAINGGTVYFPCGNYLMTSNTGVIINSPKINIQGQNEDCVVFNYTGTGRAFTIQMNPFTTDEAGFYRGFHIIGTSAGSEGILSGQIVSSHWQDIDVSGFTGGSASGIHLHNKGNLATWTERNTFINVSTGGIGTQRNTQGWLLDSDATGDSFGYNRWLDIKLNVSTSQFGFNLASGFLYNSVLTIICNGDSGLTGSSGAVCINSHGNWDGNKLTLNGEISNSGPGTGTQFAVAVQSGGRFSNLWGSNVNVLAPGGAQVPWFVVPAPSTSPNVTLVQGSSLTSFDTGTYVQNGVNTTVQPIQRANFGSLGLLIGNNIESPYVSMFQGSGNEFDIITVPSGGVIGTNGIHTAHFDVAGNLSAPRFFGQCNSLTGTCVAPGTVDGDMGSLWPGFTSTHRSGYTNSYFTNISGINESLCFDSNCSGGIGTTQGSNISHPIMWSYTLDPNNFEIFEKQFQSPLASTGLKVFGINHGSIGQGPSVRNIAGTCTVSGSNSCTWSFTTAKNNVPVCVATPEFDIGSTNRWWVTPSVNGCQVTFSVSESGTIDFVVIGAPN